MLGSSPTTRALGAAAATAAAVYKDKHEQVVRIAASDVAAVAGYHEWVDVRNLFLERLLYQDLDHLLRLDAENVGIQVEDRWQRSERLLAKAGIEELRAVRKKAGDGAAVENVQDAQALRGKARSLLKEAEDKKMLSKAEARELENDLRHEINTQFGTRNENFALAVYERRSGTEVICSNERILVWPFPGSKVSGDGVPDGAVNPPIELSKGWTKRESRGLLVRLGCGRPSPERPPAQLSARTDDNPGSSCADGPGGRAGSADTIGRDRDGANGVNRPPEGRKEEKLEVLAASCLAHAAIGPTADAETAIFGIGPTGAVIAADQALSQRGCRRSTMAATKSVDVPTFPLVPPVAVAVEMATAAEAKAGVNGTRASLLLNGAVTTTASERAISSGTAAAPVPVTATSVLMNAENFGGDAVYAWGEGPSAAAAEAEQDPEELEELPDAREWSVWKRDPYSPSSPTPGVEGSTRDGGRDDAGGISEMEDESLAAWEPLSPARSNGAGGSKAETLRERRKNACFVLVGAVDGVAEEVTDAPEDAETWETRQVVVEVKNRMNKARHPPPLYDQIQLVTYMLMIGAPVGDLVQFVKTGAGGGKGKRGVPMNAPLTTADDVLVSRVELDCRVYRHRKHWEDTILPRLYEFARMVYRFRGDDLLRWRYLLATPEEQREMLVECCPYLDDVIPKVSAAIPSLPPPSSTGGPKTSLPPEAIGLDQRRKGGAISRNLSNETAGVDAGAPSTAEAKSENGHGRGENGDVAVSDFWAEAVNVSVMDEGVGDAQEGAACTIEEPIEEQKADETSSICSRSSTVTVLSQKSRRGEEFLEPLTLGDLVVAVVTSPPPDGSPDGSPVAKKPKTGDPVAVDTSLAQGKILYTG